MPAHRVICPECDSRLNENSFYCQPCNQRSFEESFDNWTSGDKHIDQFIRNTQIKAKDCTEYLLWIPFEEFISVNKYDGSEVGTVFTANWTRGPANTWDSIEEKFVCKREFAKVALISLGDSASLFLKELQLHYRARLNNGLMIRLFGITREPITGNYMLVAETVEWDLRHFVSHHFVRLSWKQKLAILYAIACGLNDRNNGNDRQFDFGQSNTTFKSHIEFQIDELGLGDSKDFIPIIGYYRYDLLPYFAPEVLTLGANHSPKAEVYSFGMMMWEFAANRPPFYDIAHDATLIKEIGRGFRPKMPYGVPDCYAELMQQCWHSEPILRPKMSEIIELLSDWHLYHKEDEAFAQAERRRIRHVRASGKDPSGKMLAPQRVHPQAIYTSRILKFPILPAPRVRPKASYNRETSLDMASLLVRDESFFMSNSLMQRRQVFPEPQSDPDDEDLLREYELAIDFNYNQNDVLVC